jgi:hypothetical protein
MRVISPAASPAAYGRGIGASTSGTEGTDDDDDDALEQSASRVAKGMRSCEGSFLEASQASEARAMYLSTPH